MERDELDEMLSSVFRQEIAAPPKLVLKTTRKIQKAHGVDYALGISIFLNIITFIGLIFFIAIVPKGIVIKVAAYTLVCCFENLIIALIMIFKDSVSSTMSSITQL